MSAGTCPVQVPMLLFRSSRSLHPMAASALPAVLVTLTGCAFSTVGVGYDPYVRTWVDDHPFLREGQGVTLSLQSREDETNSRAQVSVSWHDIAGQGLALYWRLMGVTEIGSGSLLFAVGGPAKPYANVGLGFEFIQYPEGAQENWLGNPCIGAALGLRAKKDSPVRWFVEVRGSVWVWLPWFPEWPFESIWAAGAALSGGADLRF